MNSMIIIYSTETCPRCQSLKVALIKQGIPYEEKPLDAEAIADCLCDTGEHITAAPLVKDGHVWHFASDFFDGNDLKSDWLVTLKGIRPHKDFSGTATIENKVQSCRKIWGD